MRAVAKTLGLICAVVLWGQTAMAQNLGLPPLSDQDAAEFPAIGRFGLPDFATTQGCTATLVAPDLIITAAHCVSTSGESERVFAAGWSQTGALAMAGTRREIRHPDYGAGGGHSPLNDVALVILAEPVVDTAPLSIAQLRKPILPDLSVALLGYNINSPDLLSGAFDCLANVFAEDILRINCSVTHGNSGGPILAKGESGEWEIVAIVSSQIDGDAIAVAIPDWLLEQIATHLGQ